jgi:hypothetical protein
MPKKLEPIKESFFFHVILVLFSYNQPTTLKNHSKVKKLEPVAGATKVAQEKVSQKFTQISL